MARRTRQRWRPRTEPPQLANQRAGTQQLRSSQKSRSGRGCTHAFFQDGLDALEAAAILDWHLSPAEQDERPRQHTEQAGSVPRGVLHQMRATIALRQYEFPVKRTPPRPPGMPGDPRPWFQRGDTAVRYSFEGHCLGSIKLAAHLNRAGGDLLEVSHAGVSPLLVPWKVRQVAVDLRNRDVDIDADLALPHVPNLLVDGGESRTGSQPRTSRVRALPGGLA